MGPGARLGILAALAAAAVAAVVFLPIRPWMLELVERIRGAGPLGAVVYVVVYVVATVLFLPGSVLTLGGGFAYGPVVGMLLVSPASVLGATLAFTLGRTLARDWVARKVEANPRFSAIDRAVGRNGFKIVLLLRLSPVIPFNLVNYALGLTHVRLRDYVLASFLGMLPGTLLYVYLGSVITNLSELGSDTARRAGPITDIFYWGGLVATVAVTILVTRIAKRALQAEFDASSDGSREVRT